jgi:hypothetical protein
MIYKDQIFNERRRRRLGDSGDSLKIPQPLSRLVLEESSDDPLW